MRAILLSDSEYENEAYSRLDALVCAYLEERGFTVQKERISRDDLAFCKGCFGCWVKTPGECVIRDKMGQINRDYMGSDVAIYLTPIVFGQFSANIKNALDRWVPNILPLFYVRADGSTMHPPRYKSYPRNIMLGYGAACPEDAQLFRDISKNHRKNADVIVDTGSDEEIIRALGSIALGKVEGGEL
jgi:hypothetical protein